MKTIKAIDLKNGMICELYDGANKFNITVITVDMFDSRKYNDNEIILYYINNVYTNIENFSSKDLEKCILDENQEVKVLNI